MRLSLSGRAGAFRAACVVPFLTTVDVDLSADSEVEGRENQETDKILAINLIRSLLFVKTSFDERLSGLLKRLTGKDGSCRSHQGYFDLILEKLKKQPVME